MGFMDSFKASVKNAASKTGELAETTSLKSKISNLEYENDKLYKELGILHFQKGEGFEAKAEEICKNIQTNLDQIDKLNKDIEKNKSDGKAEREANRQAAKDVSEKEAAEKAASEGPKTE